MWKKIGLLIWLTALSACDIRKKSVPIWLLWVGGALAGAVLLYQGGKGELQLLSVFRSVLPGAAFLLWATGTGKAGCADGLILIVMGLAEGAWSSLIICMGGLILASLFSGILLLAKRAGRNTKIPFVPFLEAGWMLAACGEWGVF